MDIKELVLSFENEIIDLRRHFHMYPEKSWDEHNTQEKIIEVLNSLGIENKKVCETGVLAYIESSDKNAKTIGIRADIDALEIMEDSKEEYASKNPGLMHACGHDAHTAILLGVAKTLVEIKDELKCNVLLIFQPAEEFIKDSGAKYMSLNEDILKCDRLIALHIWGLIEAGKASLKAGPIMASADTFDIKIQGKGGHGALPNEAVDPIIAGCNLVNLLQTIVSREIDPKETSVVSVTYFQGGTSSNTIPNDVYLKGTVRSFNNSIRDSFKDRIDRMCQGVALSTNTKIDLDFHVGTPATINDEDCVKTGLIAAGETFGADNIIDFPSQMGGEDFAKYKAPYCLLFLGGGKEKSEDRTSQHNPKFDIDESSLKLGVEYFVRYVLEYGNEQN